MYRVKSIENTLVETGGRPAGFDYMRLVLAALVIVWHSFGVCYGVERGSAMVKSFALGPFRADDIRLCILPMFFALSGFLVAGSLERCRTLVSFLGLRVIRIYPALAVEVFLSALLLGPLLTSVPLAQYFTAHEFALYLFNITGHIHFELPGVFLANPRPFTVNSQLWTVPIELLCYIVLAALVLAQAKRARWIFPVAAVALVVLIESGLDPLRYVPTLAGGAALVVPFLGGISLYVYRDHVPRTLWLFVTSLSLFVLFTRVINAPGVAVLSLAYPTVYLGLCNPRRIALIRGADYSYGMYLYGFVIQQAVWQLLPGTREWYWNTLVALALSAAFAGFSWHRIEKPALKLRSSVARIEQWYLQRRGRKANRPGLIGDGEIGLKGRALR